MKNSLRVRRPYTIFTKIALAALGLTALAYASEFIVLGFDLQIAIVVGCLLLVGVLVSSGWRWTPVVGAIVAGGILLNNPWLQHNLSLPPTSLLFLAAASQVVCSVVAVIAGLGATVQNYWPKRRERAL